MRINYDKILKVAFYPLEVIVSAIDEHNREKNDDSRVIEQGEEIIKEAQYHEWRLHGSNTTKNYSFTSLGDYAVSRAASDGIHIIPCTSEYRNPAIGIAVTFAFEHDDKKLLKALVRVEESEKKLYETRFKAYHKALESVESKNLDAEILELLYEDLDFIERHQDYSTDQLFKIREEKNKRIKELERASSSVYSSYSERRENERKKLEREVLLINTIIFMNKKKRKKVIVAKRKEIEETKEMAFKQRMNYKARYAKMMKKYYAAKKRRPLDDKSMMAMDIIDKISHSISMKYYEQETFGHKKPIVPPEFEIDEMRLEQILSELEEKYYSSANTKKR